MTPRCIGRLTGVIVVAALACRGGTPAPDRQPQAAEHCDSGIVSLSDRARAFAGLEFAIARRQPVQRTVNLNGTLGWDPAAISVVNSPVRGRVLELHGNVGDRVSAGTIVAVIDNPDNLDGRFTVRATNAGVITARAASVGQVLDIGQTLLRVVDDSHLWLLLSLPLGATRPGVGSHVTADVPAAGAHVVGTIGAILPEADSISHAAVARVTVDNADHALTAGMSVLATAGVGAPTPAAIVPRASVVFIDGRSVVFVADGERYRPVAIALGPPVGGADVAVLTGLHGGERVVTVGAQQLANSTFDFRGLGDDDEDDSTP